MQNRCPNIKDPLIVHLDDGRTHFVPTENQLGAKGERILSLLACAIINSNNNTSALFWIELIMAQGHRERNRALVLLFELIMAQANRERFLSP